ncbi:MAG: DEAD/DEAH box helicase [Blastomonas sp.]|nr:DEAD/DEAH box helicase [Blastomonas sp.]
MNDLPIDALLPALRDALSTRDEVVLEAPPGAGKTTRVPLALLDAPWLDGQKILMLEPRRLAARAAAERLASELGERVGETVGYRIRLDSKVGPNTRIEVVTEGILARRLQDDPALDGVGLVIFDEFHERSLDADLALALTLNGRAMFRAADSGEAPLKVLLMSATLEGERLSALLGDAPGLRREGRMFPVDIRWGAPFQPGEWIEPRVVQTVQQALVERGSAHKIVMLTGAGSVSTAVRAIHAGAIDFLEKPFLVDDLVRAIGSAVSRQIQEVEQGGRRRQAEQLIARLSDRERDVLCGMVLGLANKIIAYRLGLSPRTVEAYRAQLMSKLGVRSLAEAVQIALEAGLEPRGAIVRVHPEA